MTNKTSTGNRQQTARHGRTAAGGLVGEMRRDRKGWYVEVRVEDEERSQ